MWYPRSALLTWQSSRSDSCEEAWSASRSSRLTCWPYLSEERSETTSIPRQPMTDAARSSCQLKALTCGAWYAGHADR